MTSLGTRYGSSAASHRLDYASPATSQIVVSIPCADVTSSCASTWKAFRDFQELAKIFSFLLPLQAVASPGFTDLKTSGSDDTGEEGFSWQAALNLHQ